MLEDAGSGSNGSREMMEGECHDVRGGDDGQMVDVWNGLGGGHSNTEKDDDGEERRRLIRRLKNNKQGTIDYFCSNPYSFGANTDGMNGGGLFGDGKDVKKNGAGTKESSVTESNNSRTLGKNKFRAQANIRRKGGLNPKLGGRLGLRSLIPVRG